MAGSAWVDDGDEVPSPTSLQGREPLQAYGIAVVMVVVAVLNLVITTGAGAAKHPTHWTSEVGIVLAIAVAATVRFRNRLLTSFLAIFAAFFVTFSKAPSALEYAHFAALLVGVGFALLVSTRQRREQRALTGGRGGAERRPAGAGRAPRRRRGDPAPAPKPQGPVANRRYTPPKAKPKTPRR